MTNRRFNNYTLAIFFAFLTGITLSVILLLLGHITLGVMPEWLFDLLFAPLFAGQLIAGVGYTQRWLDTVLAEHTLLDILKFSIVKLFTRESYQQLWQRIIEKNPGEFLGFSLGILLSIGVTLTQVMLGAHLPAADLFPRGLSSVLVFIFNTGSFAGLLGRCGRVGDYSYTHGKSFAWNKKSLKLFFAQENINYVLAVTLGLLIGIALCATLLTVVGATCIVSMGNALPLWLTAGFVCASIISSSAGSSAYIGRCFDTLLGKRTLIQTLFVREKTENSSTPSLGIKSRLNLETSLTLIGVAMGITLGISLLAFGITAMPFFGAGLPPLFSGIFLLAFCVSGGGGLGNRLGHALTKFRRPALIPPTPTDTQPINIPQNSLPARKSEKANESTEKWLIPSSPLVIPAVSKAKAATSWKRYSSFDNLREQLFFYQNKEKNDSAIKQKNETATILKATFGS